MRGAPESMTKLLRFLSCAALLLAGCVKGEDALVRNFREHAACLEELRAMAEEDVHWVRIAKEYVIHDGGATSLQPPPENRLLPDRSARYEERFEACGVPEGIQRDADQILFLVSTVGFALSGRATGYAYSRTPPGPLVTTLEWTGKEGRIYKRLRGNWYMFYLISD